MNKGKRFKDPIYGYMEIDESIIVNIIDTAGFQRLRNIIQTSYSPLFSSAVHNRFVHSLGVYHLGCIVSKNLAKYISENKNEYSKIKNIYRYLEIFELACLLHDLGHAPFSHTGEEHYLENNERDSLHDTIVELTKDKDLGEEIKSKIYKAAPHELMSVIVALRDYSSLFKNDKEKSFFARCIVGYQYVVKDNQRNSFFNCLISLLNSSVIDVDKLDYLIRDAFITGFDTVKIDYIRLLSSVKIRQTNKKYQVVYTKNAISIIENVIYAHDAERKWIQNHPVVQYETYLLQNAIKDLKEKYKVTNLFSYQALTEEGIALSEDYRITLLCDADIIFLMKNLDSDVVKEYFTRKYRRHSFWKTEAEYRAIFNDIFNDNLFDIFENNLEGLVHYLNYLCKSQNINESTLLACEKDIAETKRLYEDKESGNKNYKILIDKKQKYLKWLKAFERIKTEQDIEFDFVIIKAKRFNSGFSKEEFAEIQIEFDSLQSTSSFQKVANSLKAEKSTREKFFYVFYKRKIQEKKIDLKNIASIFAELVINEAIYAN